MPFQSHLRDFSTAKVCQGTCPDCPKRFAAAQRSEVHPAETHMGRSLPDGAPEVLSDLRRRVRERMLRSSFLDLSAAQQNAHSDGRL